MTLEPIDENIRKASESKVDTVKKEEPLPAQRSPARSPKKPVKKVLPKRVVAPEIIRLMEIINESTDGSEWSRVVNEKNIMFYKKAVIIL